MCFIQKSPLHYGKYEIKQEDWPQDVTIDSIM